MARRRKTEESLRDLFRDALELMAENPAANASLTGLARRLATSPRQLERAFAEAGSTTFRAELTSARVRRAERFLRNPALTVAEVAKAVGYEQPPHFAKAFRAVHGVPPARWRRNTYGLGRPSKHDRFAREHARRQRAQEDSVKRWVAETIERAEREGRRALPFRHSDLSD
jgi:AraC family transcriptional regulator, regulatory protein of adaptative response / methylphosphotriester-DNA alkyltransferase methyltransferase